MKRLIKFENEKNCLGEQLKKISIYIIKKNQKEFISENKSILKTQQRLKSEKHNVFTEEINKLRLSSNDNKRMRSIDLIEK